MTASLSSKQAVPSSAVTGQPHRVQIVWRNVIIYSILHLLALYGLWHALTRALWLTLANASLFYLIGAIGVTAGAHRLWSHKSYSARLPMRVLLMLMYTIAGQNDLFEWSRDHRVHHRYSETSADPHNAKRGFFFSHVGWLLTRKHPDVISKGSKMDFSDLLADPVVSFHRRFYLPLFLLLGFALPVYCACAMGETLLTAFLVSGVLKYTLILHSTWAVNSVAHLWGTKPYDRHINPAENIGVALSTMGEGWHNYHHTFPWDYRASELPAGPFNLTKGFIDACWWLGWAYDRKTVPQHDIIKRASRTGDGSHYCSHAPDLKQK